MQEHDGGIPRDTNRDQIFHCLLSPLAYQCPLAHQTPQDLSKLHIEQMNSVQGVVARVDTLFYALSGWGLKQPVDDRRGIEHDHRALRSSRNSPPVSRTIGSGLRLCRRSRNSASVGRSAISRNSTSKYS